MTDLIQQFDQTQIKQKFPDIRPGDTVRVHQKIKETVASEGKTKKKEAEKEKERIQIFEGTVLYVKGGRGMSGTFCVRKISEGVGVERIFPIYSPNIIKIEVMRRGKVRRAKLFYLRRKDQKMTKIKEKKLSEELKKQLTFESDELKKKTEEGHKKREEEKKTSQAVQNAAKAKKAEAKKAKAAKKEAAKPAPSTSSVSKNTSSALKQEAKKEDKK